MTVKEEILRLRNESDVAYIGSVNEDGFPQIKAMLVPEHKALKTQYFSTNVSSKRAGQFQKNPKASVYYSDNTKDLYKGALFTGTMEVCLDHDTKAFLWRDGDEMYYPAGIDDPDYCVFKFTAETVNFYHAGGIKTFSIDEIE
jgi:general stress protein 26